VSAASGKPGAQTRHRDERSQGFNSVRHINFVNSVTHVSLTAMERSLNDEFPRRTGYRRLTIHTAAMSAESNGSSALPDIMPCC
jgi:hypothetical protein